MPKLIKNKLCVAILLTALIFLLTVPEIAAASTVKAAPINNWNAQTLYKVRPLATVGPDPLTPTQIISAYNLATTNGGSGKTIAIVDAYDDPNIASDLATFSTNFNLPPTTTTFTKHKMSNSISTNADWAVEISLDVEWAHAIAPNANILLVEATSSSLTSLLSAVQYATSQPGVVAVSMSWGGSEFSTETAYDSYFTTQGITFFASAGDNGAGVMWPASSPNVIGVGGTTLNMAGNTVTSETAWSGSGGGVSAYEKVPAYQSTYGLTYTARAVPDVSYDADPNTGVYVYDSLPYNGASGWWDVGGTSAGSPQWAAIQALGLTASNNNFYQIAKSATYSTDFRDVTSGSNGNPAGVGYDLVTGLGSPLTTNFQPVTTPDFSLSSSPSTLTILAGSTGTSTLTTTSLNGYSGTVDLTATDANGWASIAPASVNVASQGTATATVSINVPTTASAGTYTATVTGVDSTGAPSHTTTITFTVTTPDFSVSASPSSINVKSGAQGTSTITVTALNGFTGQVTLSAQSSLTTTFSQNPIQSSGTSTLTITVPSGTASGTYPVTVTATGTTSSHTTTVTVTVTNPNFSIAASPNSINVRSGSQGTSKITISALNGFTGQVSLTASASGGGLTATVNPSTISGSGSSTLTVKVPSTTRSGTFTVTVVGISGTVSHSTTVTVNVSRY